MPSHSHSEAQRKKEGGISISIDESKNSIHSYAKDEAVSGTHPESVETGSCTETHSPSHSHNYSHSHSHGHHDTQDLNHDIHWKIKHGKKPFPSYHERTFCDKCTLNWSAKKGCPGAAFNMSNFHRCDQEFYIPPSKFQPGPLDYKAENTFHL